jgi:NADPH2:quinone reductase
MKAVLVHRHGGPEVLQVEEIPIPEPQEGQVLVKNQAIGVNLIDIHQRAGVNYPVELPLIPGMEAAGLVESLGPGVEAFKPGDRVGYAGYMGGNYAQYTVVPADRLAPIPEEVNLELAAACLMPGMTAHCLSHSVYPIQEGDTVLVHDGAGEVGFFLVQMASRRGARVITTVSAQVEAKLARSGGADHVIVRPKMDFVSETLRLTVGRGVQAVYDGLAGAAFDQGIKVLGPRGIMVVYGILSAPLPPFDISRLSGIGGSNNKGSLYLTWPVLSDYIAQREDLLWRAGEVLEGIASGALQASIADAMPLTQAAEAHRLLERDEKAGNIVLIP